MLTTAGDTDPNFRPYEHIQRLYNSSECRTPLIVFSDDGNALPSIQSLAAKQRLAVWCITMDTPKNEQNALDYLEVGLQNGDWVFLVVCPSTSSASLRQIAITLMTIQPEPKLYPKRELFRLWIVLDKHYDLDTHIHPRLPVIMTQNAIVGMKPNIEMPSSPQNSTLRKRTPVDPNLFAQEMQKRERRRAQGKEEQSESDHEDAETKQTGLWFYRSTDLHIADSSNIVTKGRDDIFDAIEKNDIDRVNGLLFRGVGNSAPAVDVNDTYRKGMNPLMWAVMMDSAPLAKAFLEAGADPNLRTLGAGIPPLFMSIDTTEMLMLLIQYGADLEAKFEGKRLMEHPDTSPVVLKYLQDHPELIPS